VKDEGVFGFQLLCDLYEVAPGVCDDIGFCYQFLIDVVQKLDMQMQSLPVVFRTPPEFIGKEGLSASVMLVESSVVIHTLSKKRFISVDVYSCKRYDAEEIEAWVQSYFGAKIVDSQFIKRGFGYAAITVEET
jgi:S-adenosylmethionine decarboxylase